MTYESTVSQAASQSEKTKIFVDGNCIVCSAEISHYKRIAPDRFELVDISDPSFDSSTYGLSTDAVNKHMHVLTPDNKVLKGVDAFAHIWSRIPRYDWAEKAIKLPGVNAMARLGYEGFARIRPWLPKKRR